MADQDPPPPKPSRGQDGIQTARHLSKAEKIALFILAVASLAAAALSHVANLWLPPTMQATLLAITVGTLCYAFLGGVVENKFAMGGVTLAGTAAIMGAMIWFLPERIGEEMSRRETTQSGHKENQVNTALREENRDLREQLARAASGAAPNVVQLVSQSPPDSEIGSSILDLFKQGAGPFQRELESLPIKAVFHQSVRPRTFSHCRSTAQRVRSRPVVFRYNQLNSTEVRSVVLLPGEDMGMGICDRIDFTVQLGCDALLQLMPGEVERCDNNGIVWKDASRTQSPPRFDLVSSILNPELVTQDQIGAR